MTLWKKFLLFFTQMILMTIKMVKLLNCIKIPALFHIFLKSYQISNFQYRLQSLYRRQNIPLKTIHNLFRKTWRPNQINRHITAILTWVLIIFNLINNINYHIMSIKQLMMISINIIIINHFVYWPTRKVLTKQQPMLNVFYCNEFSIFYFWLNLSKEAHFKIRFIFIDNLLHLFGDYL